MSTLKRPNSPITFWELLSYPIILALYIANNECDAEVLGGCEVLELSSDVDQRAWSIHVSERDTICCKTADVDIFPIAERSTLRQEMAYKADQLSHAFQSELSRHIVYILNIKNAHRTSRSQIRIIPSCSFGQVANQSVLLHKPMVLDAPFFLWVA